MNNTTEFSAKSQMTGKYSVRELACTEDEFIQGFADWQNGMYIQDAFPMLDADDREFLMTGVTPEEWLAAFGRN